MELYAVYPVLIGLAAFVVGLVALFFIVKAAILSALAEDRRRQSAKPLRVEPGQFFEKP